MSASTVAANRKRLRLTTLPIILALMASAAYPLKIEIVNIRVGQGDATLILGPEVEGDRTVVLFDAGDLPNRPGGRIVGAVLAKRGIREVDHMIVSHYDADHIGGIVSGGTHGRSFLLGPNAEPGAVGDDDGDGTNGWTGNVPFFFPDPEELGQDDDVRVLQFIDRGDEDHPSTIAFAKYRGMAKAQGVRKSLTTQNDIDTFEIELGDGAKLTCLAGNGFVRQRPTVVPDVGTENERSLAFLLSFGGFHYLVAGDLIGREAGKEDARIEEEVGEYLVDQKIEIDVLHVNHHGADNASATAFLELIDPEIAIVSVGNANTHGHPHNDVLDRLIDAGVYRIIQTSWGATSDRIPKDVRAHQAIYQNDIVITSDGETYTISTSRTFAVDE